MTKIIALDATTGRWATVETVEAQKADNVIKEYNKTSAEKRSPWVFLKTAANATLEEIEDRINGCMEAYVILGGRAAAE